MKQEREIRVLVVEPMKRPYEKVIPNELANMQEIVGGYIEALDIEDGVTIVCNEEGKINRLPLNRALRDSEGEIWEVIAGVFFIAGDNYELGEFVSLTDEQIAKYKDKFLYPQEFYMLDGKIAAVDRPFKIDPDELEGMDLNPKPKENPEDKPTRLEFRAYQICQFSGVVNMCDIGTVHKLTGLDKPKIIYIMKHYSELDKEYN